MHEQTQRSLPPLAVNNVAVGLGMGGPLPGPEIFSFEVSDRVVTSAERVINGKTIPFYTSGNAEFTLQGDDIVLTRTTSDSEHLIVFSDADSDGLYAITSRAEIETGMPDMGGGDDDNDDDGNADGTYTEVAHGSGELVDLVAVLTLTEPNIDML